MGRFIDPRADWAFKRIFGCDDTKECLITFLNGLFKGELVIKDVTFGKTEQVKQREDERGVIFDVTCKTEDGRIVIVEMQKKEQQYFVDRALYYSAKAIVGQGVKGRWNYHLAPVYTVCFMDFEAEYGLPHEFRTDLALCNLKTGRQEAEKLRIVYLQLPLFKEQTEEECKDDILKCWIYILKNMEEFKEMPFLDKYPVFRKLAEISDLRKLTPEEHELYDEDIKIMRDLYATHEFEIKKRQWAVEKAKKEGILETAKRFLAMGLAPEQVAKGTNLSIEQVLQLMPRKSVN